MRKKVIQRLLESKIRWKSKLLSQSDGKDKEIDRFWNSHLHWWGKSKSPMTPVISRFKSSHYAVLHVLIRLAFWPNMVCFLQARLNKIKSIQHVRLISILNLQSKTALHLTRTTGINLSSRSDFLRAKLAKSQPSVVGRQLCSDPRRHF